MEQSRLVKTALQGLYSSSEIVNRLLKINRRIFTSVKLSCFSPAIFLSWLSPSSAACFLSAAVLSTLLPFLIVFSELDTFLICFLLSTSAILFGSWAPLFLDPSSPAVVLCCCSRWCSAWLSSLPYFLLSACSIVLPILAAYYFSVSWMSCWSSCSWHCAFVWWAPFFCDSYLWLFAAYGSHSFVGWICFLLVLLNLLMSMFACWSFSDCWWWLAVLIIWSCFCRFSYSELLMICFVGIDFFFLLHHSISFLQRLVCSSFLFFLLRRHLSSISWSLLICFLN